MKSKILVILVLVTLLICLCTNIYFQELKQNEFNNLYKDTATGLQIQIPKELSEIGYVINKVDLGKSIIDKNRIEYQLALSYKEPDDGSIRQTAIGYFYAVPLDKYKDETCQSSDANCIKPKEFGRNSKFVFVSEGIPPDSFAECIYAGTPKNDYNVRFTPLNLNFCQNGMKYRFLELDPNLVKITEPTK